MIPIALFKKFLSSKLTEYSTYSIVISMATIRKSRAFASLAGPYLEYSTLIWDPYFKQDILAHQKIQLKGAHFRARFITANYPYRDNVTSILEIFNGPHNKKDGNPIG